MSAPELGRRERKKLAARTAILDASSELFIERGFERTRIETIAERADVGVGTVYNHFETKADILVAILVSDVAEVVERTSAIVERGTPSAALVVRDAVGVLLDVMERRPRDLWRDLIGHALLDGDKLGAAYARVERVLRGVIETGLERLRENGCASDEVPLDLATDITFALAKTGVYAFAFDNSTEKTQVLERLERQVKTVFPYISRVASRKTRR